LSGVGSFFLFALVGTQTYVERVPFLRKVLSLVVDSQFNTQFEIVNKRAHPKISISQ
jgi:hypothetical protein